MAITVEQQHAVDDWLKGIDVSNPTCSICGSSSWDADIIATWRAPEPVKSAILAGGPTMPRMLRLTCKKCGGVILADAERVGI